MQPINNMNFLFCENPLDRNTVDEDYFREFQITYEQGHRPFLFNFEKLVQSQDASAATKKIPCSAQVEPLVYRGWMLKPEEYSQLYDTLLAKNYRLINTPREYQNCHYLPDSLKYIERLTPKTVWTKWSAANTDFDSVIELIKPFGHSPIILKDYVKSQKHNWETACFIPDASDADKVVSVVKTFLDWQGDDFNRGLVFREFVPLADLTYHSKSGMPLKQEYRLFFYEHRLILCCDYWEEGEYEQNEHIPLDVFIDIARGVESRFFTMDIAKTKSGNWIIIELGDAQVAGLPHRSDYNVFYQSFSKNEC